MLRQNLQRNILAGGFGLAVVTLQQLILLPVFLYFWPKEQYGIWLVLMSFPAYFQLADVGLVTAVANRMSIALANSDIKTANNSLCTALFSLALLSLGLLLFGWGFGEIIESGAIGLLGPGQLTRPVWAMMLLAICAAVAMEQGVAHGVMRATGYNYRSEVSYGLTLLAEMAACIGGLSLGYGLIELLMVVTAMRCATAGLSSWVALLQQDSLAPWKGRWNTGEFRLLAHNGIAFMAFPMGNALINQGSVLVVAAVFGPATVVVFTAARTLANTVFAWPNLLSKAIGPEIARLHALNDNSQLHMVIRLALVVSLAWLAPASVVVFVCRDWLLHVWTNGKLMVGASLLGLYLCRAMSQTFWAIPSTALTYTNRHHEYSIHFTAAAVGFILLLGMFAQLTQVWIVPALLIVADIYIAGFIRVKMLRHL